MTAPRILAIDAAKYFGWAFGKCGDTPISGSLSFAKSKSPSHGAVFWGSMKWTAEAIKRWSPDIIVIEAPLPGTFVQGKSNASTARILTGLPACIEGMAYGLGTYDVRIANISSIRAHFIKKGNLKGEDAKPLVMAKCRSLGWVKFDDEDQTFDRSDALAIWSFAEAKVAPKLSQPVDDLFLRRNLR